MKVAFVLRHLTEKGSSKYAVEVIKYFLKEGHEVHVFANKWDKIENVRFHKIPILSWNFLIQEFCFTLFSTILVGLQKHKFDIVYSQPGRFFSPDVAGVHICATAGKIGSKPTDAANRILYKIEKFNVKRAKKIVAVSDAIKNELMKNYNVPEKKIKTIYNGVNLLQFSLKNRKNIKYEIRRKYKMRTNEKIMLFVGNPFSRKGLKFLIESLPFIKNAKLIIIGRDNINPYLELAEKLKVRDKIIYIEFVDKISEYFAAADIFVFPTLYEPFGLVILEAMASGLPVITSRTAGAAELIEDGKEGLLLDDPASPKEIAEKVNYLIDNNLINRIGRNARKKTEKYTWERTAKEWLRVFEEIK